MRTKIAVIIVVIAFIGLFIFTFTFFKDSRVSQNEVKELNIKKDNKDSVEDVKINNLNKPTENMNDNKSKFNKYSQMPSELSPSSLENKTAIIKTSKGEIEVELYGNVAPKHVSNFIFLAEESFYSGLTFHRVEPGFVIQGGDPLGSGMGGPGYTIPAEIPKPVPQKERHTKGALAMARLGDSMNPTKASSGSQFYITLDETGFLDGEYTVFGGVIRGMEVVESIKVGDKIDEIVIK